MSDEEEDSLLMMDFPGMEEISAESGVAAGSFQRDNPEPGKEKTTSKGVHSQPSGSGMTFFLDSSLEDEDLNDGIMSEYQVDAALEDANTSREIVAKSLQGHLKRKSEMMTHPDDQQADQDQDPEASTDLQKELTQKYMSGQLSFQEYLEQMELDEDDEDEDEEDEEDKPAGDDSDYEDEEWIPSGEKSKAAKKARKQPSKQSMEDFAQDLKQTTKQQLGRKLPRVGVKRGRRKRLDPTLQGLMGEANLRFARGDTDNAIKMCMEVIRQDPGAPEPFQTLSTLYEETGEFEKAVQFALIGMLSISSTLTTELRGYKQNSKHL
jgi:hypothetical protein